MSINAGSEYRPSSTNVIGGNLINNGTLTTSTLTFALPLGTEVL
jgi:hypothetical protein